jgi:methionine biosynthesis protein MetW
MGDSVDLRLDQKAIVDIIEPGASVLDLGCGRGELLAALVEKKQVKAQGIEIDDEAILQCVTYGLNVFHDDIDRGLSEYSDGSFDYVMLNQTFQQVRMPDEVLKESLRVGRKVIVGFPNFASLSTRYHLGLCGRTPVTPSLPYEWHDTPNLHFLSILDFIDYCKKRGIKIEEAFYFNTRKQVKLLPNLLADIGVFLISKGTLA